MKTITTIIAAIFLSACASLAAIDGFAKTFGGGDTCTYSVPAGKILVLQQVSYPTTTVLSDRVLNIHPTGGASAFVALPSATNGLYTLPKPMLLPAGTSISGCVSSGASGIYGVLIDTSDAPLFVGGGSSLGNVALVNDTMTGELQLPSTAGAKVLFQSSTDLANWDYDNTVVVQRSTDKSKVRFTVPVTGEGHYYRALVRRTDAG